MHGCEFSVVTDHKPLIHLNKTAHPRLTRWRLRLSPYAFQISWKEGSTHSAPDAMSRDPSLNLLLMTIGVSKAGDDRAGHQRWGNEHAEFALYQCDMEHLRRVKKMATEDVGCDQDLIDPVRYHEEEMTHWKEQRKFVQDAREKELRDKALATFRDANRSSDVKREAMKKVTFNDEIEVRYGGGSNSSQGMRGVKESLIQKRKQPLVELTINVARAGKRNPKKRKKKARREVDDDRPRQPSQELQVAEGKAVVDEEKLLEDEQALLQSMIEDQHESWVVMQKNDPECKAVLSNLTNERVKRKYRLDESGILQRKTAQGWKSVVPEEARMLVMYFSHNTLLSGHQGIDMTLKKIRYEFYWKSMDEDVRKYVKSCICAGSKLRVGVKNGKAGLFKMWGIFEAIHIDGCEMPLSRAGGFRHMLTVVDRASRMVELIPLRTKSARDVAKALFDHWICRYAAPLIIFCDQDTSYQSVLMKELSKNLGGRIVSFSPYSHHNGLAEAFNRTSCAVIRSLLVSEGLDGSRWSEVLPAVRYVLNSTINREIGVSAMGYVFGREPARIPYRKIPKVLQGDSWAVILNASLKALQRVRTAANYRRFVVDVTSVMRRNEEQKRNKTHTGYRENDLVWVWFFEESKKRAKTESYKKWRRGSYVRISHSRRSHYVYVAGRLYKKSDMHVQPRVPTIKRCLVGNIVEETKDETSDESDVESQIRSRVNQQRRLQEENDDAQWIDYYNLAGADRWLEIEAQEDAQHEFEVQEEERDMTEENTSALANTEERALDVSCMGEKELRRVPEEEVNVTEVDERKRSKSSKKRLPMEERNPGTEKTVFHILEDEKSRVLTLMDTDRSFHCFTRSAKSVNGRWRYQPTYFTTTSTGSTQTHYKDHQKPGYEKWILTLDEGWRVTGEIKLLYVRGQHFSVTETERSIIEEGLERF